MGRRPFIPFICTAVDQGDPNPPEDEACGVVTGTGFGLIGGDVFLDWPGPLLFL